MISIQMPKLVINSSTNLLILKPCLTQGILPSGWKKKVLYKLTKNTTNSVLKTTGLSLFPQSVAKFLNVLFVT